ncbi:MAG: hypothetical protein M0P49_02700 [Bacilli bacterium]|nr:hypothetical protein [Bacilli bacterium]
MSTSIENREEILREKTREAYLSIAKSLNLNYSDEQLSIVTSRVYVDKDGNENMIFVKHGKTPSNDTLYNMYHEVFGFGSLEKNRRRKWEERKKELSDDCTMLTVVSFLAVRLLMTGSMRNILSMKLMSTFLGWLDGDL